MFTGFKKISKSQNAAFNNLKPLTMNVKRTFGTILTLLGIISLIYAAKIFLDENGEEQEIKLLIIYSVLGLIFFIFGISLIRTTKDEV